MTMATALLLLTLVLGIVGAALAANHIAAHDAQREHDLCEHERHNYAAPIKGDGEGDELFDITDVDKVVVTPLHRRYYDPADGSWPERDAAAEAEMRRRKRAGDELDEMTKRFLESRDAKED